MLLVRTQCSTNQPNRTTQCHDPHNTGKELEVVHKEQLHAVVVGSARLQYPRPGEEPGGVVSLLLLVVLAQSVEGSTLAIVLVATDAAQLVREHANYEKGLFCFDFVSRLEKKLAILEPLEWGHHHHPACFLSKI